MDEEFVESVYKKVTGELAAAQEIPEAKDLFEPGESCDLIYKQVYYACARLLRRLDPQCGDPSRAPKEDSDLTQILRLMDEICWHVGREMFRCGAPFQSKAEKDR